MEIYFILFFLLFLSSKFDGVKFRLHSRLLFKISIIVLIVFVGIRYNVGNDYKSYYQNYLGINSDGSTDSNEVIYTIMNIVFNFDFLIFSFSLLSFLFLYYSIRKSLRLTKT